MVQGLRANEVLGEVMFDEERDKLGATTCYVLMEKDVELKRGLYVELRDPRKGEYYIGQIIDGPYYPPSSRLPNASNKTYNAIYLVELAATVKDGVQTAVLTRPTPGTPMRILDDAAVQAFLGTAGEIKLGRLPTQPNVSVGLDPATLTRHVGVFGTTGSGKSNTIQVMMEEASEKKLAILTFDVEGEYTRMDEPTDKLRDLLKEFDEEPRGIKDLKVYVPFSSKSAREDAIKFSVKFAEMNKDVFSEVAELTKMEKLYFMDLIKKVEEIAPAFREITLSAVVERLRKRLEAQADNPTLPEFIAEAHTSLYSKLTLIERLGVMDAESPPIDVTELLVPGRVSVVDFSDASDPVRNLVIADLLDKLFRYKIENPGTPKILVVLEEAHNFISKEKRDRMLATLMLLLELARRGRKRGICLCIVTQQPAHLPSELLELCNTRIMHRMSSTSNINVLKESTGNVPDSLWETLPSLGRGEAIVASPRYGRAIIAKIRPAASRRLATE